MTYAGDNPRIVARLEEFGERIVCSPRRRLERYSTVDRTGAEDGGPYVDAQLDRAEVVSGDVATLTLRVIRIHPGRMALVGLVSRLSAESHAWPIAVSRR